MPLKVTEEANGVFAVELYDGGFCADAVGRMKALPEWSGVRVSAGVRADGAVAFAGQPEVRSATRLANPGRLAIHRDFEAKMGDAMLPLVRQIWGVEFTSHSEVQVIRYGPGGHYKAHSDSGPYMKERFFTILCYLNDDFEGGRTSFPSLGYTATPRTGTAMLFPASYVHRAEPVLAGKKFVMVSWVLGAPPISWL